MVRQQQQQQQLAPRRAAQLPLLVVAGVLLFLAAPAGAIKLKFVHEECLSYTFNQYE